MTDKKPPAPRAGGAFIAFGLLGGAVAGIYFHEPSLGTVIGFGLGVAAYGLLWVLDKRR